MKTLSLISIILLTACFAMPASAQPESRTQPLKPVARHADTHAAKKSVAAASGTARVARAPAAKRKKRSKAGKILLPIRISELLPEEGKQGGIVRPTPVLAKAMAAEKAVDLDMGGDLPWPVPDSPLLSPRNRDIGFHVGVNYHLDQKWDLTGLAGMGMVGNVDAYPLKPNVEQIGIRAKYRF